MGLFTINGAPVVTVTSIVDGYKSANKFSNLNNAPRIDYWGNYYDVGSQLHQAVSLSLNSSGPFPTVTTSISALWFDNNDSYNLDFYAPCMQVTNKVGAKLYQYRGTSIANAVVARLISYGHTSASAEDIWCTKHTPRNVLSTSAGNRDLWTINGRWIPKFNVLRGGRYGILFAGNGNTGTRSLDMTVSTVHPRVAKINSILFELKESAKPSVVGYFYFYDDIVDKTLAETPDVSLTSTSDIYMYGGSDLAYNTPQIDYRKRSFHWFLQRLPNLNEIRSGDYNRLWNTVVSSKRQEYEIPSFQLRYGVSVNGGDNFFSATNTPGLLLSETNTGRIYQYTFVPRITSKALASVGVSSESWLSTQFSAASITNRMYRVRLAKLETSNGFLPTNTYVTAADANAIYTTNYANVCAFYSVVSEFGNPWTDDAFTPYVNNASVNVPLGPSNYSRFYGSNYTEMPAFFKYANGKYVIGFKRLAKANWYKSNGGIGITVAGYLPVEKAVTTIATTSNGTITRGTDFYAGTSSNISYYRFFEIDAANLANVSAINAAPVTIRHLRSAAPNVGVSATGWFTSALGAKRWYGSDESYVAYSQLHYDASANKMFVTDHLYEDFSPPVTLYTTSLPTTSVIFDANETTIGSNWFNTVMKYNFPLSANSPIIRTLRRIFTLSTD